MKKGKLELTWVGKEDRPRLEPRVLIPDPSLSYHSHQPSRGAEIFDNRLIFGDNLLALKGLEEEFAGKVKCIYIDPPYNTGSAFERYDDGIEHSLWLSLISQRLARPKHKPETSGFPWATDRAFAGWYSMGFSVACTRVSSSIPIPSANLQAFSKMMLQCKNGSGPLREYHASNATAGRTSRIS